MKIDTFKFGKGEGKDGLGCGILNDMGVFGMSYHGIFPP